MFNALLWDWPQSDSALLQSLMQGLQIARLTLVVSCRLSLTTDSKKNGRFYRGLLFLVLCLTVFIYYITPPQSASVSVAHSAPSCLVFVLLFQSCQTMWLHLFSSCFSLRVGWSLSVVFREREFLSGNNVMMWLI